ncbi:MAG: DUF805 domain-containing protein [Pseudomonadota bacterium]
MAAGPQTVTWALFSWRGRIRRATFVWGSLLLLCVLGISVVQILATQGNESQQTTWGLVFLLSGLVSVYCIAALGAKRLQDMGLPGWVIVLLILSGFYIVVFLALSLWPGNPQPNKWGPPPVQDFGT